MKRYGLFIGIDVSKDKIDVAFGSNSKPCYIGEFSNDEQGWMAMIAELSRRTKVGSQDWFFCFENTGDYSKGLSAYLFANGLAGLEENPLKISLYLKASRGKDDRGDALGICSYAWRHRDELEASQGANSHIVRMRKLLSRRAFLVKKRTALKNISQTNPLCLTEQEQEQLSQSDQQLKKIYTDQIKQVEKMISAVIKEVQELRENSKLIQSVKGIGPVISAYILVTTNNFKRFNYNSRKYACYSGIAPFPNQSGKFRGKNSVNHRANKRMKALLSNAVNSAIQYDPQIKQYYERKLAQGKEYPCIANAIKNKLIARVFAVVKRQTPFVNTMAYTS